MVKFLKIIYKFGQISMLMDMEYRANFVTTGVIKLIDSATSLAIVVFLLATVNSIAGWSAGQILLMSLTFTLSRSLVHLVFSLGVNQFNDDLNRGDIDKYLCKPINLQFYVSLSHWDWSQMFRIISSIGAITFVCWKYALFMTWESITFYIFSILIAAIMHYCLGFIFVTSILFINKARNVDQLSETLWSLGRWPVTIFGGLWKYVFITFLPLAFAATIPVGLLTRVYPAYVLAGGFIVAMCFVFFSSKFLEIGLRKYSGAGG